MAGEARARVGHATLKSAHQLSGALVVVAAVGSAVGVFYPDVLAGNAAMTAGNARGTDLVILAVALPTLVVAMLLTARGSWRAPIVWLGALGYILYNSIFFAYGTRFNQLFLVYAATLSLAVWSVVALLQAVDVAGIRDRFAPATPVRVIAGYVVVTNGIFALLWLKDVLPAIAGNTVPAGLQGTGLMTNPVQMTDFAFSYPLVALTFFWLWQRRPRGYLLAGAFLVYGVIEAVSVASDQLFGHISDLSASAAMVPVFVVLALIGLVPAIVYLRALHEEPDRAAGGVTKACDSPS
jgi:hypothetical protein